MFWYKSIYALGPRIAKERYGEPPFQIWSERPFGQTEGLQVLPPKINLTKSFQTIIELTKTGDKYDGPKVEFKVKEEPRR